MALSFLVQLFEQPSAFGYVGCSIHFGSQGSYYVPLQAQIFNSAAIYFDFNPPVITNQTLHTVGTEYLVGTSSPTNVRKATRVAVFPNPVAEWAAFQLKEGIFNQHRLVVTDAFGRNVTEAVVSGRQYLFQRKALPPGIYFFRVEEASGRLVEAGNFILR